MRRPDLIVGADYVLYGINDQPDTAHIRCVYLGRHDGVLELADGSTYHSTPGTLHFRISNADTDRTVLLESASTVIETTQTRTERERREAEHDARVAAARAQARAFLAEVGITEVYTPGDQRPGSTLDDHVVSVLGASENADELTINGLSIAELRAITGRAHPPASTHEQGSDVSPRQDPMADQRRYAELRRVECRECDWRSGDPHEDHELVYAAWQEHFAASGHRHSWDYTIRRSAAVTDAIATIANRLRDRQTAPPVDDGAP